MLINKVINLISCFNQENGLPLKTYLATLDIVDVVFGDMAKEILEFNAETLENGNVRIKDVTFLIKNSIFA